MGVKIEFVSSANGLELINECIPKPSKYYIPEWFKNINHREPGTVKSCPSFPDFFSMGYVLPMWMDCTLEYSKERNEWQASSSSSPEIREVQFHSNRQFIDKVDPYFNGVKGNFVFKLLCPWKLITPPGWSVLQLPLFYHFNQEWSVLPGVIDTDIHHEINQQILYHKDNERITIERGTPLAVYIPFKRKQNFDLDVRYQNEKDKKRFAKEALNFQTKFQFSGVYRALQRERDKKNGRR
jgi:hypothetical protein